MADESTPPQDSSPSPEESVPEPLSAAAGRGRGGAEPPPRVGEGAGGEVPKWGDPISSIPAERQEQLRKLAEAQRAWVGGPAVGGAGPDRDPTQSPFAGMRLTGAEVFFLATGAISLAQSGSADVEQRVRNENPSLDFLHLEGANLFQAHLEGANLIGAHLEGANLIGVRANGIELEGAHLQHANLNRAHLDLSNLSQTHLEGAYLSAAHLERADLKGTHLEGAHLSAAHLERAHLTAAHLEGAVLNGAHLERASLFQAQLEGASLIDAHLEGADLTDAHLEGANLRTAHLEGANLSNAHLARTNLRGAFFSAATTLEHAAIADKAHGVVRVADVRWQEVNLAVISQWSEIEQLGDELRARKVAGLPLPNPSKPNEPLPKGASRADREKARELWRKEVLFAWRNAARAYRQLASVMRDQGMNDEADRFAYRGQLCQRQVYRYAGQPVRRGFSWFLDALSGYGYKPQRSLFAYLAAILGFAALFLLNSHFVAPHLSWDEAIVLSMSSFHGRGFFNPSITLGDTYARLAAFEAFVGLVIEVSFIATFTQRFFGR